MNDEDPTRDELHEEAILAEPVEIGGCVMRPLSAATYLILERSGNPLWNPPPDRELKEEEMVAGALEYYYMHAAPIGEVASTDDLGASAVEFGSRLPVEDLPRVLAEFQAQRERLNAAMTTTTPTRRGKPRTPRTSRTRSRG